MRNILTILLFFICVATQAQLIKISELPAASTLGGTEVVPSVQSGVNRKISANQYKTFVWDLSPTISTNDTIGYVIVRRTSDGKIFKRSVSTLNNNLGNTNLTVTGPRTVDGDLNQLDFENFEALSFEATTDIQFQADDGPHSSVMTLNDENAAIYSTEKVVISSEDSLRIDAPYIRLKAINDIDIDADGDVKINGVSGTSGEFIGNVDGHLVWAVPAGSGGSGTATSAILEVETTTVGNVTTGEDVLWTYTLPADTLSVNGQFIRGRISGQVANNANLKSIVLAFGGTDILSRSTTTPTIGQGYTIDWECIRIDGTTQKCNATFSGSDGLASAYYALAGETLSGTVAITLTGEATATDDIRKHSSVTTWGFGGGSGGGGGSGDLSLSDLVTSETPSGTVDGVNDDFTLAFTPAGFFHLYVNGLLQEVGGGNDYTRTGPNITFVTPPASGSIILASYVK